MTLLKIETVYRVEDSNFTLVKKPSGWEVHVGRYQFPFETKEACVSFVASTLAE